VCRVRLGKRLSFLLDLQASVPGRNVCKFSLFKGGGIGRACTDEHIYIWGLTNNKIVM
jgi:hypothetical protein